MIFGLFKRRAPQKPKWPEVGATDIQATPRPIKTAAASLKAYKELLDKAGYFVGDREMRSMAHADFKDDIKEHEDTLKYMLETATEEHQDIKEQCSELAETIEDTTEAGSATKEDRERLRQSQEELAQALQYLTDAKAELDAFEQDRTAFIVALVNHELHNTADPRAHHRL